LHFPASQFSSSLSPLPHSIPSSHLLPSPASISKGTGTWHWPRSRDLGCRDKGTPLLDPDPPIQDPGLQSAECRRSSPAALDTQATPDFNHNHLDRPVLALPRRPDHVLTPTPLGHRPLTIPLLILLILWSNPLDPPLGCAAVSPRITVHCDQPQPPPGLQPS
jgi:hypothetical protein